jgi:hypothetical protein
MSKCEIRKRVLTAMTRDERAELRGLERAASAAWRRGARDRAELIRDIAGDVYVEVWYRAGGLDSALE